MADLNVGGAIALVASSSVAAAALTGLVQSRLEKSRRDAARDERRRDERKELYVRFRSALDKFGQTYVSHNVTTRDKVMSVLIATTVEMNLLAPENVSVAAKKACDALVKWRTDSLLADMKAVTAEEKLAVEATEWQQRMIVEGEIEEVTALMRAELQE